MDFSVAYQEFLEYSDAKGHSSLTISSYKQDHRCFLRFLAHVGGKSHLEFIDSKVVRRYIVWMKSKGYAPATMKRKIDSLSSFFNYLVAEELVETSPMKKIDRIKVGERIPTFLSKDEIGRFLNAVDNYKVSTRLRDKAMIRVFLYTGLRRSELCKLNWEAIDFSTNTIHVKQSKGKKDRIIPMNKEVYESLWEYLQSCLPLTTQAVFLNRNKNRIAPNTLKGVLRKLTKKAGIAKNVTPHVFRHSFATLLLQLGTDIVTVQQLLGHEDVSTTQIYSHTTPTRMAEAVDTLTNI